MSVASTPPGGLGIVFGLVAGAIGGVSTLAVLGSDDLAIAIGVAVGAGATFAVVSYALTRY